MQQSLPGGLPMGRPAEYPVKLLNCVGKLYSSIERQIETDFYDGNPMGSPVELGTP
jgi:hypothetical protein